VNDTRLTEPEGQTPATGPAYSSIWSDLAATEFTQGFITAAGYRTRFIHAGQDSDPVLLLLHGVTGHAEAYVRNLAAHAQYFSVWAIDLIGHGWSAKADHPLEITHYVDHVLGFLDAIGAEHAAVSGESLGGWVAARLAADHPKRLDRVVLNTMGGTMANPEVMERLSTLSMEAARDPSWARVRTRLEWLMADPDQVTDDLIRTRQAIFQQPGWLKACGHTMALQDPAIRRRNMITDDDLRAVAVPALVLWTTKDPSGPVGEAERLANLIPGSTFAVMEDCGHWPQWEDPNTFNRLHLDFLRAGHEKRQR